MGRSPCCSKVGLHKGPWSQEEDALLTNYIQCNGEGNWRQLPKYAGLLRCGKSCRLRWVNYLRPDIKRGNIGADEEDLIIRLHSILGNRWSLIAGRLPGRTDNEIKNYWNSHISKTLDVRGLGLGLDPIEGSPRPAPKVRIASKRSAKKLEIYAPKPIRPSLNPNLSAEITVGESSDCTNKTSTTTTSEEETKRDVNYNGRWIDEADSNMKNFEVDWLQDNSLETIYDEYLQLLNSDGDYFPLIPMDHIY